MIRMWQVYTALVFCSLMLIIGFLSGVSLMVAVSRAVGWSILVLLLIVVNTQVLLGLLPATDAAEEAPAQLDITLPAEEVPQQAAARTRQAVQQIENDIEEMVKNDPVRVAELTRKMGLE
ncbi:MAG TPA: hypothetical protein VHS59_14665 [Bacillota bacterium]|nr:hypothetical protein [Bacillota bacterium]